MTAPHLREAEADTEAFARRAWAWLAQVADDRSLPVSALRTAAIISGEIRRGGERIDVGSLRKRLAALGCPLDRDVKALVRGRHLLWRVEPDGLARPAMLRRQGRSA